MKHATLAGDLKEFASAEGLCVIHAEPGWIGPVTEGLFDFFTKLTPLLEAKGRATVVVTLGSDLSSAMLRQAHIHLILGDAPLYAPNVLHVSPAYIWGFWYLDEVGLNAHSSLRLKRFQPDAVDEGDAAWFFNGVSSWMLDNNVSRLTQRDRGSDALAPAQSVVFCQEIEHRTPRTHYLTTEQIIRNAARAAGGGTVYVKPHPHQSDLARRRIEALAENDPNIVISDASIHDLAQASDWVISQNSAAAFEAIMQRKKLITCGRCDFHHASLVARSEDALRHLLRDGASQLDGFAYEKYLYWFLAENCLEPQRDGFAEAAWARIADKCML